MLLSNVPSFSWYKQHMYRKHQFWVQDWYKMRVVMILDTYLHIQTSKYLISSGNLKQNFDFFCFLDF